MKKLLLSILLAFLPLLANAETVEIDGIWYKLFPKAQEAEVTNNPNIDAFTGSYSGDIVIPSSFIYNDIKYSVTSIGYFAFFSSIGLTSVDIPNSVTSIDTNAFTYCSSLSFVTIPNSVTSIGSSAFGLCSSLSSVSIPNSVTSIGTGAFLGCTDLTRIKVEDSNPEYDSRNDCNAIIRTSANELVAVCKNTVIPPSVTSLGPSVFAYCTYLTSFSIPNSVTSIGVSAFHGCSNLVSISLHNNVTSIGDRAFQDCSALTSFTIPNSITRIGEHTFSGCLSLKNIDFPKSVRDIKNYAFEGCINLTSIHLHKGIEIISGHAFHGCSGLTSIVLEDGNPNFDSRNDCNAIIYKGSNSLITGCKNTIIPPTVTSISTEAFYGCSGLTTIDIPNSVTKIDYGVFYGCSDLKSIIIPNSVKQLPNDGFRDCISLTSVYIPNSVTFIGEGTFRNCSGLSMICIPNSVTFIKKYAFEGCSSLKDFYCFADILPDSYPSIFNDTPCELATLHVPARSLDLYKQTKPWSDFGNIVALTDDDPKPTGIKSFKEDSHSNPVGIYSLDGKQLYKEQHGLNIIRMSDGTTKKVMIK